MPFPAGVLLRFFLKGTLPCLLVPYIQDRGKEYGSVKATGLKDPASPESGRQKVVLEFSSPNIITEFQARHLRSTLLGVFIANLHEIMGYDVVRINYLGDWGQHIGLFGVGWQKYGLEEKVGDYKHLAEVYAKVDAEFQVELKESKKAKDKAHGRTDSLDVQSRGLFAEREEFTKKMEERDETAIKLWERARDASVTHYKGLYDRLGIKFDSYEGESQVTPESVAKIEELLKVKGLCEEKDGSLVIDLDKHDIKGTTGIIRKNGLTTYFLRDLAAILDRYNTYDFDKMIYVVSADQEIHFKKVKKTMELLRDEFPGLAEKLVPVHFSRVTKMSEKLQSGDLEDILDEIQKSMKEAIQEDQGFALAFGDSDPVSASMGVNALLAKAMSSKRSHNHSLSFTEMTSFEVGTGPHLQRAYASLCQSLEDAGSASSGSFINLDALSLEGQLEMMSEDPFIDLSRLLIQYPEVTIAAYDHLEASGVMSYLASVIESVDECLDEGGLEGKFGTARKGVLGAARQVLENGMVLLGMTPGIVGSLFE